ncbi:PREDICTED: GPI ethanolamine phosphate transferase 1 [Cyphomyrmex costatus]|uniref:GPI ethanolamine phosphate transferase 1 n=1 Tax=Cyphomyrmex costatus TaxID=456900 RepID=A0A195CSY3_9HYME|nr:PREDICTED: GPI ethanolamine phosphate transferase 1 [Cyphomyrmex costatus]KYN03627.1 GPI ethanolamine phosphate transferase 1 [Cyphomyrmex costatus]
MFIKRKKLDVAESELSENTKKFHKKQWLEMGNNYLFALWGLTMHLILLWGVLDVNFHSPIIRGMPIVPAPKGAPAKRLLLFVADGLRFQTFIEKPPPYLRDAMKNRGVWGISHTRVPTESRPGHVAIAAGLYEDPSAIFKGWQDNPVDFDSVFNQSHATWAWGSPDIIPIFTKDSKHNVYGQSYPSTWQDFDTKLSNQTRRLDSWVFDAYLKWLQSSVAETVRNQNGIILFFHLLGCDTLGHANKPNSREYVDNMNYVDQRIEETVNATEDFFGKDTTAYIFTSDHGMTDWGSHGSGLPSETETPLVTWGAGVKSSGFRQDVEQASITPLIASLIGIPIPINNEGALPWQYFNLDNREYVAYSLISNVKQLMHQITENRVISCQDSDYTDWRETQINDKIRKAQQHISKRNIMAGIREGNDAIRFSKEALLYFRLYQRIRFLIYLSIMWLSWIVILFFKIAGAKRQYSRIFLLRLVNIGFPCLLIIMLTVHIMSNCNNWRLPCYATFAIISAWLAVTTYITSTPVFTDTSTQTLVIDIGGTLLLLVIIFAGLTYRFAFSIGILLLLLIRVIKSEDIPTSMIWTSIALCVFPLLPVVEPYSNIYIVMIGVCIAIAILFINEMSQSRRIMEIVRLVITSFIYMEFIDGRYWISWIILLTTPLSIWCHPIEVKKRTLGIMLGFFCSFTLLSASYEPIFFMTLTINLISWLEATTTTSKISGEQNITEDLIKAAFFMLYVLLCFFGMGNMASISSFDPSWTRHFITVFSPYLMTSLILLKLSIPLILVGCVSYILELRECKKPNSLAVLFLGDCLSLPLMYCVTPYGSWLDIGTAISKFIIAISLPCLFVCLRGLSHPLIKPDFERFWIGPLSQKKHIV